MKRAAGSRIPAAMMALLCALPAPAPGHELKPQTVQAFERYVQLAEAQMDEQGRGDAPFLWVDRQPEPRRGQAYAEMRKGEVVIERLQVRDGGKPIKVPDGLIHHWVGTVFIPGASLAETLGLVQDYDHHAEYYKPEVLRSKILRHTGDDYLVYLRLHKKKIITVVLDSEHEVHYQWHDVTRAEGRSHTTRVVEVENPGKADESTLPPGNDHGYLWRLNTYWRFEQKDGGTYAECATISLTRDVPTGLGWLIGPFINSVPRESLTAALTHTREGVLRRMPSKLTSTK